jgi:hypothetical protein
MVIKHRQQIEDLEKSYDDKIRDLKDLNYQEREKLI